MKFVLPIMLILLCACEAKKSSGTIGRAVDRQVPRGEVQTFESNATGSSSNKSECDRRVIDLNQTSNDVVAVTASELVTGARAHAELKTIEVVITDRTGSVKLIESRAGQRFSRSCRYLTGVADFNLRYAAPKFFSLQNGNFGKLNGRGSEGMAYRVKKTGERLQAYFEEVRLRGTLQQDLTTQLPALEGAEIRYFFVRDHSGVEIRSRKEDQESGLIISMSARYEIKSRD